jgi:hypothetical protein
MSYESFKKKAAERGLSDLTKEEYDNIVQAHPGASTPALVRFVKAARKGVVGSGERSQNKAFALGAKDHMYKGLVIEKAAAQKITLLFEDGRMADYMWKGDWDGIPGRLHAVEVEEGERQKRDSDETYQYRDLKVATVEEGKIDLKNVPLTDMSKVDEDDLYTAVAFHGTVRGVWPETMWDKGEQAGEYDYKQGAYPTCALSFKENGVFINAHFGPYKRAVPLIQMEDWDINVAKTIDDLTGYMYEAEVVVVGHINSIKEKRDEESGEEVTYIHLAATALFDAEEAEVGETVAQKDAPKKKAKVVKDPAKEKTRAKDLVNAMLKGIKVIGPDCTIAELRGKYIDEGEDDKMANMAFQIAMKKYNASKTAGDDDADDDDGAEPDADAEENLEEPASEEDDSGEEDEPEDEPADEDDGEAVEEEEEEEDEEPTPDSLLENAILDWLEEKGPREVTQIKSHFRKKKFGGRETKVAHVTAALETLEAEEEITKTANLVELAE